VQSYVILISRSSLPRNQRNFSTGCRLITDVDLTSIEYAKRLELLQRRGPLPFPLRSVGRAGPQARQVAFSSLFISPLGISLTNGRKVPAGWRLAKQWRWTYRERALSWPLKLELGPIFRGLCSTARTFTAWNGQTSLCRAHGPFQDLCRGASREGPHVAVSKQKTTKCGCVESKALEAVQVWSSAATVGKWNKCLMDGSYKHLLFPPI
jgi:hypothetical protein